MNFIYFSIILILIVCSIRGFGVGLLQITRISEERHSFIEYALGLFVIAILTMSINLLFPINSIVSLVLLSFGAISFVKYARLSYLDFLYPLVFAAFLIKSSIHFDSEFYHLPRVFWIKESNVVLGLANLNIRLGFNSFWFYSHSIFFKDYLAISNGIFFSLFVKFFIDFVLLNNKYLGVALLIVFLPFFGFFQMNMITSPTTDLPSAILIIVSLLVFIVPNKYTFINRFHLALFLVSFAFFIKLSHLLFLLILIGYVVYKKIHCFRPLSILGIGAVIFSLTNFLTSGCYLFPIEATCIQKVSWTLPSGELEKMSTFFLGRARLKYIDPEYLMNSFSWIKYYFQRIPVTFLILSLGIMILGVFTCVRSIIRKKYQVSLMLFFGLLSFTIWFVYSSYIRMAMAPIATILLLCIYYYTENKVNKLPARLSSILHLSLLVSIFLLSDLRFTAPVEPQRKDFNYTSSKSLHYFHSPIENIKCYGIDLPCMSYFHGNLEKFNLYWFKGFRIMKDTSFFRSYNEM